MSKEDRISSLRRVMAREGISAMIIPSNDPHFGEYTPAYYKCREWLSYFTGSAGSLVITHKKAALWTDSRYFSQAEKEMADTGIILMKMKVEGTPTIESWLLEELSSGGVVAIDETLFSYSEYASLSERISPLELRLIKDLFCDIWYDRPQLVFHPIELMEEEVAGESVSSKHKRVCESLRHIPHFAYIVSALDETAWLCNVRGSDIEYNPLPLAYSILFEDKIVLFVNSEALTSQAEVYLLKEGVEIREYSDFFRYLSELPCEYIRVYSSNKVSAACYIKAGGEALDDPTIGGTIGLMKGIKNSVELDGFRRACLEDSKAWSKLLNYLDQNIISKSEEEYMKSPITEYQVAQKIIEFRKESEDYVGESFEPIVAYGANGALPHYTPSKESSAVIQKKGLLLIDTGGHYKYGTTDTTRTIPMGPLTKEQMVDYTAVLKGMIRLSQAKFIKGTRGAQLDFLARGEVYKVGKRYLHGTGHGIGHCLCVHEGPHSIRMEDNPVELVPGMVISNEPAIYVEDSHGVRIENVIVVTSEEGSDYYGFETITKVPISKEAIVFSALTKEEVDWLSYHGFISQPGV